MTANISWDPTIFDNHHEQVVQEEFVTSENSDVLIDSDTREIDYMLPIGKVRMLT